MVASPRLGYEPEQRARTARPHSGSITLCFMDRDVSPASSLTGACMCGAVRFEISSPLLGIAYCHCKRCQRRTGTAYSVSGLTHPGSFEVSEGLEHVGTYRPPDDGWLKGFCTVCGSQLFTTHPE